MDNARSLTTQILQDENAKLYVTNFGIDGETVYVKDSAATKNIENLQSHANLVDADLEAVSGAVAGVRKDLSELEAKIAKGDVAYVKEYGAVGDGTTDDSAAIQAAMDSGNSVIMFNPGKYKVKTTIRIPSYKHVTGYGAKIVYAGDDSGACFMNAADGTTGGYTANTQIRIEGITFDCANAKATIIALGHVENCAIVQCFFEHLRAGHFVELNACKNTVVEQCYFYDYSDPTNFEATEMLEIDGAYAQNTFPFFGPYDATPCLDCKITNCVFENPRLPGTLDDTENVRAIGNRTDSSNKHTGIEISHNFFNNIGMCMHFTNIQSSTISKNYQNNGYAFYYNALNSENNDLTISENKLFGTKIDYSGHNPYYYACSGIAIGNSSRTQVINNRVGGFKDSGIHGGTSSVVISGNSVQSCGFRGIDFSNNVSGLCSNNECNGSGQGSTENIPYDLVYLNNATGAYNVITGNRCGRIHFLGSTNWDVFTNNVATSTLETAGAASVIHGNVQDGTWIA